MLWKINLTRCLLLTSTTSTSYIIVSYLLCMQLNIENCEHKFFLRFSRIFYYNKLQSKSLVSLTVKILRTNNKCRRRDIAAAATTELAKMSHAESKMMSHIHVYLRLKIKKNFLLLYTLTWRHLRGSLRFYFHWIFKWIFFYLMFLWICYCKFRLSIWGLIYIL